MTASGSRVTTPTREGCVVHLSRALGRTADTARWSPPEQGRSVSTGSVSTGSVSTGSVSTGSAPVCKRGRHRRATVRHLGADRRCAHRGRAVRCLRLSAHSGRSRSSWGDWLPPGSSSRALRRGPFVAGLFVAGLFVAGLFVAGPSSRACRRGCAAAIVVHSVLRRTACRGHMKTAGSRVGIGYWPPLPAYWSTRPPASRVRQRPRPPARQHRLPASRRSTPPQRVVTTSGVLTS